MKSILFVDEDLTLLRGLKRLLRAHSKRWHLEFCSSAQEAMVQLESTEYDVVITDMRLHPRDGADFLREVRDRFPHVVRIVLSGTTDREAVLRSTEFAHQYLGKPCAADELRSTIERTCALRERLEEPRLLRLASGLTTIPSLPSTYTELLEELRSEEPSVKSVGAIVAKDPGLTVKIMQLVNSAFFGLRQQVDTPEEAAAFLGIDTLKSLALAVQVFAQFPGTPAVGRSPQVIFQRSLTVAGCARELARLEGLSREDQDRVYLAGMVYEIGELVLAGGFENRFRAALDLAERQRIPPHEAERRVLGGSHAQVAAYILGIWGFPGSVVEAVAYHHSPEQAGPQEGFRPLTALHMADTLVDQLEGGPEAWSRPYLETLGFLDSVERWRDACAERLDAPGAA